MTTSDIRRQRQEYYDKLASGEAKMPEVEHGELNPDIPPPARKQRAALESDDSLATRAPGIEFKAEGGVAQIEAGEKQVMANTDKTIPIRVDTTDPNEDRPEPDYNNGRKGKGNNASVDDHGADNSHPADPEKYVPGAQAKPVDHNDVERENPDDVEIPEDTDSLDWNEARSLARRLSGGKAITNRAHANKVIAEARAARAK